MSYRKSYGSKLSFQSRLIMMEGDEFDAEVDYLNNQYLNQKNYAGTVTPSKASDQGPNGHSSVGYPVSRVRLNFPVYPDEAELPKANRDAALIRHDLDPFLNPSGDTGVQDPIQVGAKVNLKSYGNDPAYDGKTNNLRVQYGSVGDSSAWQRLAGGNVRTADINFGGSNPNPSRPKRGQVISQGPTTGSQVPGAFIPATTQITSLFMKARTVTITDRNGKPKTKTSRHNGIDFSGGKRSTASWLYKQGKGGVAPKSVATEEKYQEPCFFAFDGKITVLLNPPSPTFSDYGPVVYVEHAVVDAEGNPRKIQTRYGHLEYIAGWKKGDTVKKGEMVGHIGSQGGSTGPHLHFEVREWSGSKWVPYDPLTFFGWNLGPPAPPDENGHVDNGEPEEELDGADEA